MSLQSISTTWGRVALGNRHRFRGSHLVECTELEDADRGYCLVLATPFSSKLKNTNKHALLQKELEEEGNEGQFEAE